MFGSLSARLLLLTIGFGALVVVVILASSIPDFRRDWLEERLRDAQIAVLSDAGANGHPGAAHAGDVLRIVQVHGFSAARGDGRTLILGDGAESPIGATYDLRGASGFALARQSWDTLLNGGKGLVRVIGDARGGQGGMVSVVVNEQPLRSAMLGYLRGLLMWSALVSVLIAGLIYSCLIRVVVRPLQQLAAEMARFSADPEEARLVIEASDRTDEIGDLQRSMRHMEEHVRLALAQKAGLASLGEAVAKVNHDLRNILATARLVSNRLSQHDDPGVRTVSVTLMRAIDRAIEICSETLRFGRPQELNPRVIRFHLRPLAEEVGRSVGLSEDSSPAFLNHVSPHMQVEADPEHLFRALQNLMRNSVEAIGEQPGEVAVRCYDMATQSVIEVSDTGPGLPEHARENMFKPFKGTTHAHGAGLGLVNVQEIAHAHGGEVRLVKSDGEGTIFRLHLPVSRKMPLRHAAG